MILTLVITIALLGAVLLSLLAMRIREVTATAVLKKHRSRRAGLELKAYTTRKERVSAIVQIPAFKEDTFGRDLGEMLQTRLTFNEALAMESHTIMTRQRLKIIQRQLFGQLDNATVL